MRVHLLIPLSLLVACGEGSTTIGGGKTGGGAAAVSGGGSGATGGGSGAGGGTGVNPCPDADGDGTTVCAGDCNDTDPAVKPGAAEVLNSIDDDCDGKVDNKIAGRDFDADGTPFPGDCNDDEPLVGPNAVEVVGDAGLGVDENCNGQVDEPATACDSAGGTMPSDFAKAIGICSFVTGSSFPSGNAAQREVRTKFGESWTPKEGARLAVISSGVTKDNNDPGFTGYRPQPGTRHRTAATHPFYTAPRCGNPTEPQAEDLMELTLTLKVPQNANSFSFSFNFFSAEYPEFVCTDYNDRFLALLDSTALDPTQLPGQCKTLNGRNVCNISFDSNRQPISINNGFFDVCDSAAGNNGGGAFNNVCTKSSSLLAKTSFDQVVTEPTPGGGAGPTRKAGGATGWLTTQAPVKPGETITLRFLIFDEGDDVYDSLALIDNFQWQATSITAPVTTEIN